MFSKPQVLLYNFKQDERTRAISRYLNRTGAEVRSVQAPEFLESLGFLFGIPGFAKNPQFNLGGNFSDEMLVMKDFSREEMGLFLNFFHENNLEPVALKAMLTPVTQHWNSLQLHEELCREHEALKRK